jgi:hypothetical protein
MLVSAGLLKHLPTCCDSTQTAPRRHDFDIGIQQLLRRLEIMRHDSLDEFTNARELLSGR